jgi:hypothetical protein
MQPKLLNSCILLLAFAACQQFAYTARAVTFSVTPSAVSNTYNGTIMLQVTGLTNGETVVVQKFLDANTNGVVDASDWLVQQFSLTDGQAGMAIGGIVNSNVPGDTDATGGQITAQLLFHNGDFIQNVAGQYAFKLSSPGGHFAPITNLFSVTNVPYAQKFTGNVVSNRTSTTLPNAMVLLFGPPRPGKNGPGGPPLAGGMANNAGSYTIPAPPGTYMVVAFKGNYLGDFSMPPILTLGSGQTLTTNLTLTNATSSISGSLVDANNSGIGLPGILLSANANSGLMGVGFTDTNGNYTLGVQSGSGQWGLSFDDTSLIVHGYLGLQNKTNVYAGQTNVALAVPKATALFYGNVKDGLGNPLPGIDVYAYDNNNQLYQTDGYTDANGKYVAGVLGGLGGNDPWSVQISSDSSPTNYIFSQPAFAQAGGTNLSAGTAVQVKFTALLATNHITGWLKDNNGNPIAGVWVWANATINGADYNQGGASTDSNGNYSLNVANGTWTVGISTCSDCNDGLPGGYLSPANQSVVIANNNGTANFTALAANNHITGHLTNAVTGQGIANVGIPAWATINGVQYMQYARTDGNGFYSNNLVNGTWSVNVNCGNCSDCLSSSLYQCPDGQTVLIANNSQVVDFAAQPAAPLQITTSTLPPGTVGAFYSESLGATGGQPSYNWWLPGGTMSLPPGQSGDMSFSSDGTISGTPGTAGTFSFWVGVSDNGSPPNVVTQMVSITITGGSSGPLQITTTTLPDGIVGGSYSPQLDASGGQSPYSWSLTPGSLALPGGLNLSNGGMFSGTPTSAPFGGTNYYFSVRVTDNVANTVDQLLSLTIYPALTMSASALPNGTAGLAYSAQILVSGGNHNYFAGPGGYYPGPGGFIPFGSLPPGLNVSDGAITSSNEFFVISGTPTNSGTFSFTMGVYDGDANWVQNNYSITIASSSLQITTTSLSNAAVGSAYTNQLQASGGTTPYTWTIANGSQPLPSALTLSTSGLISGVPASSGTNIFIVRLTDHNSLTVTRSLTLITDPKPVLSLPVWLTNRFQMRLTGAANQTYSVQVSTNLVSTNWFTLMTTNLSASPALIQDNQATNKQRFYRVKVGL